MHKVTKFFLSVILVFALAVIMFVLDSHNLKTNPYVTQIFFSLGMILLGAVITGNILGNMRGQIGKKITFTFWKGIAVAKSYSFPTGDFSVPQLAQQTIFAGAIAFTRLLLTQVIQPVWNKKAVQMSGFNLMVRHLINDGKSLASAVGAKIFYGDLTATPLLTKLYNTTSGHITVTWSTALEGNQKTTDTVLCVAYDSAGRQFDTFMGTLAARSTGTATFNATTGLTPTNVYVAVSFIQDATLSTEKYSDASLAACSSDD